MKKVNDESPIVTVDSKYLKNEKNIIKNLIREEIENQGEKIQSLTTPELNKKINITVLIWGILTAVYTLLYIFNVEFKTCIICEGITILIYFIVTRQFNIVNVIYKKAKKLPNKDITKIVTEVKNNKKQIAFPLYLRTGLTVIITIIIPILIFSSPKLLYFKYGDGYAVIKYTRDFKNNIENIVVPDTHNGKNVIAIGMGAFENTNIKRVILPKNLESIKSKAFYGCENLERINIPPKVTEIRASAFENCTNLQRVFLPNGIINIRASAFKNAEKLNGVELPESLEYLGAGAFYNCKSLTEITIPSKVIELNGETFKYCTSVKRINLHDNIISIHGECFSGDSRLDNVILPSKIKEIRGNTFENCIELSSIIIPEGVTRIGGHAFYGCRKLSYVSVPTTVVEIGSSAFRRCYSLKSIKVPKNAVINERAFKGSPTSIQYLRGETYGQ